MESHNQQAAQFLFYIKEIPEREEKPKRENSATHIPVEDWSHLVQPGEFTSKELHPDYSIAKIYKVIGGKRFGFPDNIYPNFINFTRHLSTLSVFQNLASEEFILEETFNWLVDSYQQSKIAINLIPFLQNKIDENIETRTYHFPVLNLIIEKPFQIGNATFQFFTKDYFDQYWSEVNRKGQKKEDFDSLFSKYCGKVFISCVAKAESGKAENLAYDEACLAMDVLRLYSPAVIIPGKIFKVDLERRININYQSDHLSEIIKTDRQIQISTQANNEPFCYTEKMIKNSFENGLEELSNFTKEKRTDDLYKLIQHSISFYSFALSNPDLHLRISNLVMIMEGLLLEEGFVKNMQSKTKNRFSKLFFPEGTQQFNELNDILSSMYDIRHAITHKGNRLLIDKIKLAIFQTKLVELIEKLTKLSYNIKSKDSLIKHIDTI